VTEPQFTTPAPIRQRAVKKSVPTWVWVVGLLFVAGLGYALGVLNANGSLVTSGVNSLLGREDLNLSSVQQTYQEVVSNFDGTIDKQKLIEGANKGLVEALGDQYTVYMNAKEAAQFDNSLTGTIGGGIGVEIGMRSNVPTIVRILKDNPGEKAGLMVNDGIVKVNGQSTEGKALNDVVDTIRGEAGTSVKLSIVRDGVERDVSVTRETVSNPSVYSEVKNGIGVMTITRFDNETGRLARTVAQSFKNQGVKGVVVDLRGNGGGYVTAAQAVAGIWLDSQLVVTEKKGTQVVDELKSTGSPLLAGVPTVVLVNKSSASASEIVAGALHDHKVARLFGETTFGKGSVQKLLDVADGAMLKVTVAKWYTPAGVNISAKGITPDTAVERTPDDINANRDPQLEAALSAF
jgi:carboxyl-terminal processing protease